ncbi:MAG: hypothetical protein KDB37_12750, partial [Ilumatobacter sp.]|nr:hypothetical protein [Ilumatobacter sp.]
LKPSISMIVVSDIDTDLGRPVGPEVTSIDLSVHDAEGASSSPPRRIAGEAIDAIGARVHGPHGSATVNSAGRFLIQAAPGDEITLESDPPRTQTVPYSGGIRF